MNEQTIPLLPYFHSAVVTFEAKTAHAISSGEQEIGMDATIMRNAVGLPYIPATSYTGILRTCYSHCYGSDAADALFGYALTKNDEIDTEDTGQSSRLIPMNAHVHDSNNCPITLNDISLLLSTIETDPVLRWLMEPQPIRRDKVKLNYRHTSEAGNKYERNLCPKGTRYTAIIHYQSTDKNDIQWEQLLSMFEHPLFRIGQGTSDGLGKMSVTIKTACWNLLEDKQAFIQRPITRKAALDDALKENASFTAFERKQEMEPLINIPLNLQAESGWVIGHGEHSFLPQTETDALDNSNRPSRPYSEKVIQWDNGQATFTQEAVLPFSSIKGVLSHRAVYHYRCITGQFIKTGEVLEDNEINILKRTLFGYAGTKNDEGAAGIILADDVYLPKEELVPFLETHNCINHFTQGVIKQELFTEELFWQTQLNILLMVNMYSPQAKDVSKNMQEALMRSLYDLIEGRLAIGAGGARNHGVFKQQNDIPNLTTLLTQDWNRASTQEQNHESI